MIAFRQMTPPDRAFIASSWFESFRKSTNVGSDVYRNGQGPLIDSLISKHRPVIAYTPAVPDEILGWICRDLQAVHYVYVKQAYRRAGIATQLWQLAPENLTPRWYTHQTRPGKVLAEKFGARFNPYLLFPKESP